MACCAAAAFFISQIVLAFGSVRRRLFGAPAEIERRNDAVAWTLGSPAPTTRRPSRVTRTRRLIVTAFVAEAVLVAGSAAAWTAYRAPTSPEPNIWALAMDSLCSSGSVDAARERLTNSVEGSRGGIQ